MVNISSSQSAAEGSQRKNLEAGSHVEATEECGYWLAFRLTHISYTSQDHLARGGTTISGLCPPTSTINQTNAPQARSLPNLVETIPKLRSPLLRRL